MAAKNLVQGLRGQKPDNLIFELGTGYSGTFF